MSASTTTAATASLEKKNVVDTAEKEKTSADYYFNSYSHFGTSSSMWFEVANLLWFVDAPDACRDLGCRVSSVRVCLRQRRSL
jgi:hypothetical protein